MTDIETAKIAADILKAVRDGTHPWDIRDAGRAFNGTYDQDLPTAILALAASARPDWSTLGPKMVEAWELWCAECAKPQFFTISSGGGKASVEFSYTGDGALAGAQAMHKALCALAKAAQVRAAAILAKAEALTRKDGDANRDFESTNNAPPLADEEAAGAETLADIIKAADDALTEAATEGTISLGALKAELGFTRPDSLPSPPVKAEMERLRAADSEEIEAALAKLPFDAWQRNGETYLLAEGVKSALAKRGFKIVREK